ncbi:HlyD family efflux transporter periplasmic adaptor subunit [Erwinia endophytica]|uniref:HlyD family secretion protein n=1 Tax=Erwinia endophytica TaxID=1563158 RepID=UPI001265FC96|nr:HlyD family efflux transporter periplasmic adaptor subunit [Erwinia endophytica]KAB8312784.1 HlyD family efflux transporter periplasmic adaptor subunit [Erwinia endophytica]
MDNSLFRQEALDANNKGTLGTVTLYCPPWRWLVISLVIFITLSALLFFIFGSYTKYETSTGELIPKEGMLTISAPVSGTATHIFVKEGQTVKQGDKLMVLSSEVSTSLGPTRQVISDRLKEQRTRLLADLQTAKEMSELETAGLTNSILSMKLQKDQLAMQVKHREKQVALARTQLDKLQKMLKDGYASTKQVEDQESNLLETQARWQEYKRQLLDIQQQIVQTEQKLREQPLNTDKKINDIQRQLSDNSQSLAENESRRAIELRAPQDGTVGTIMVKTGQILNAGHTAISILPAGSELVARMMVNTQAIGFIEPNQRVVLRYKAFPYQKFGQQYGRVIEVSRSALSPQEIANLTGNNNVHEQQYRVIVKLDKQNIQVYSRDEYLKPGMALDADFLVDKRHLYEWILEPLYALGHNLSA